MSLARDELWPLQEDGNLCETNPTYLPPPPGNYLSVLTLPILFSLHRQRAKPATKREMSQFHSDDYVDFLYRVNPENVNAYSKELMKYNIGDDSPIFDGLFEYSSISAGGSMGEVLSARICK